MSPSLERRKLESAVGNLLDNGVGVPYHIHKIGKEVVMREAMEYLREATKVGGTPKGWGYLIWITSDDARLYPELGPWVERLVWVRPSGIYPME